MTRTPVNLYLEPGPRYRQTEAAEDAPSLGGLVDGVRAGSIAAAAGLQPGCRVLRVNGHTPRDVIDFQFYSAEPVVELDVEEPEGGQRQVRIEKWPDDDIGLEFAETTWDGVRICSNTCFFCFLKGNPKGLRRTLYVKDDDYRLSFLHGNFVTLTNLTAADWARLKEQRLSPLNVSVHATEPELRRRMLGYADAPDIVQQLKVLGKMRIEAHTQIVLCPGVNDGAALDRTIADLGALYPTVQTVSIVPVGATMQFEERAEKVHRAIDETRPFTVDYARALVRQVQGWQKRLRAEHGATIVHAADEYLLTARARIPAAAWYDDFPQFENGIGMTRLLLDDWRDLKARWRRLERAGKPLPFAGMAAEGAAMSKNRSLRLTLACGTMIAPTMARLMVEFTALTGIAVEVVPVENQSLGPRINVSGLLAGSDFLAALRGRPLGDLVVLPRPALDYFGRKFLDDLTPPALESELNARVVYASSIRDMVDLLSSDQTVTGASPSESNNGRFWGVTITENG